MSVNKIVIASITTTLTKHLDVVLPHLVQRPLGYVIMVPQKTLQHMHSFGIGWLDYLQKTAEEFKKEQNRASRRSSVDSNVGCLDSSSSSVCLLYTSPSPRDATLSRMPSSA